MLNLVLLVVARASWVVGWFVLSDLQGLLWNGGPSLDVAFLNHQIAMAAGRRRHDWFSSRPTRRLGCVGIA